MGTLIRKVSDSLYLVDEGGPTHGTALSGAGLEEGLVGSAVHRRHLRENIQCSSNLIPTNLRAINNPASCRGHPASTVSGGSVCQEMRKS